MRYFKIAAAVCLIALSGCSAKELNPGAERIMISNNFPAQNCKFIGEVIGSQGNWFTADITSDSAMIKGSRNEMRNQAFSMGANYIVLVNQSTSNNSRGFGGAYNSSMFGNAFRCPT